MKSIIYMLLILITSLIPLNATNLRIEAKELSATLDKYKILDTRNNRLFLKGHIKSAINFPIKFTYEHQKINGKISQPIKMQKIIREFGLNIDDKIVIYSDGTFFDAARLFWTLEVYGFNDLKLLNAGFDSWKSDGYESSYSSVKVTPSDYIAEIDSKKLATKFTTQIATKNPNQIIIDARSFKSYRGEKSSAKRYGHIPKAINIPAAHNINYGKNSAKLKTIANLQDMYKSIDKGKKVVLYCAIGRISSTNYFALRELGYDVSNYDASWKEWGNDYNLPIVVPLKD